MPEHAVVQRWRHPALLIFILGGIAQQLLLVAPAIMVYTEVASPDPEWRETAAITARWMLGLSPIAFGLGHLINLHVFQRTQSRFALFCLQFILLRHRAHRRS